MKLALCIMFTNELPYLKLHLPVYANSFDGIVALTDGRTTDGSIEYLESLGAQVRIHEWHNHWGDFATALFAMAEQLNYDAACRIDPDECLMADAGCQIKEYLDGKATLLCLSRREFVLDRCHIRTDNWPDYQARAWLLNRGIVVSGQHHEGVNYLAHGLSPDIQNQERHVVYTGDPCIYHYGNIGRQHVLERDLHYVNVAREQAGHPPLTERPADRPFPVWPAVEEYAGVQPIDPQEVGIYAPFTD